MIILKSKTAVINKDPPIGQIKWKLSKSCQKDVKSCQLAKQKLCATGKGVSH